MSLSSYFWTCPRCGTQIPRAAGTNMPAHAHDCFRKMTPWDFGVPTPTPEPEPRPEPTKDHDHGLADT